LIVEDAFRAAVLRLYNERFIGNRSRSSADSMLPIPSNIQSISPDLWSLTDRPPAAMRRFVSASGVSGSAERVPEDGEQGKHYGPEDAQDHSQGARTQSGSDIGKGDRRIDE